MSPSEVEDGSADDEESAVEEEDEDENENEESPDPNIRMRSYNTLAISSTFVG